MNERNKSPKEVLDSASPRVKKAVNEILKQEQEFQGYKNTASAGKDKEIAQRIRQVIEREYQR